MSSVERVRGREYQTIETDSRIEVHFGTCNCLNIRQLSIGDEPGPFEHFCSPRQLVDAINDACKMEGIDLDGNKIDLGPQPNIEF